jgi:hypothetical protein
VTALLAPFDKLSPSTTRLRRSAQGDRGGERRFG